MNNQTLKHSISEKWNEIRALNQILQQKQRELENQYRGKEVQFLHPKLEEWWNGTIVNFPCIEEVDQNLAIRIENPALAQVQKFDWVIMHLSDFEKGTLKFQ